ncbi:MAG TPA: SpoIIE family protein phosphatase, partial [Thermoleophilaceae bacterium]|nr:SpoIIE family protein phosphatase [Thermoleophilaceae bacterium]
EITHVAPFHPLRYSVRALLARAGVALAVFAAIAAVVLAGGSQGPLRDAEAQKGKPGYGDGVEVELGGEIKPPVEAVPPPPVDPAPPAEPVDPAPPAEPEAPGGKGAVDDGAVQGEGGSGGDGSTGGDGEASVDEDGVQGEGGAGGQPPNEDPGDDSDAPAEPGVGEEGSAPAQGDFSGNRNNFSRRPAGGSKGPEPDEPGNDAADPEPAGRPPQVVPPAPTAGADPAQPVNEGDDPAEQVVGNGRGNVVDAGDNSPSEYQLTATPTQTGSGEGSNGTAGGASPDAGSGDTSGAGSSAGDSAGDASGDTGGANGGENNDGNGNGSASEDEESDPTIIPQPVTEFVRYIPDEVKGALAALAALSILLGVGYLVAGLRARRLARQRRELLQEVGLLQSALLPPVPAKVGALVTSVAYRPADGPGAGGDFYDVLPLPGGRVGFILGDVSGHGRGALARTAFMRYTLRAYLEAGLEPRVALQVAGRVIDDNLGGDFATVLLAVHDPETGSLTYASAGHPAPLVVGPQPHEPVTAGSSPPIGVGVRTGLRQTTVPLVPGSIACLFTDGLMEARTPDGILGRERLAELLNELGDDANARRLIESVAAESTKLSDDMAAVIVSPTSGVTAGLFRTEQLELSARELEGPIARRFLDACGLSAHEVEDAEHDARLLAERFGGVVLHVVFGNRLRVEVLPRNVESIEAASRRVSAGTAR